MSEIRRTTTIDRIDVPPREPLISLGDVLAAGGWLAARGLKLAASTAVVGGKIAFDGAKALSSVIKDSSPRVTFSHLEQIASASGSAREVLATLADTGVIEIAESEAPALTAKLAAIIANDDRGAALTVGRELVAARQTRLQAQLIPLVAESCRAIGFVSSEDAQRQGVVDTMKKGTRQRLNIEVAKDKNGGIQLHLDAEGFEGGACVEALDALQAELRKRGVRCELQERRKKPARPVRIGERSRIRIRN